MDGGRGRRPRASPQVKGRGRPSGGSGEATRRQVLSAARSAFASQGFSGATMRGIAAEAGLTAMALYNYAPSKAALLEAVWHDTIDRIYADYEDVVARGSSLLEEVEMLLERSREVLHDDPDHIRFVLRMLTEREHAALQGVNFDVERASDFFTQLADRAVRRGDIRPADSARLVSYITTLLWGITTRAAFQPKALDSIVDAAKWGARNHLLVG